MKCVTQGIIVLQNAMGQITIALPDFVWAEMGERRLGAFFPASPCEGYNRLLVNEWKQGSACLI
jgi:hypothetical protein